MSDHMPARIAAFRGEAASATDRTERRFGIPGAARPQLYVAIFTAWAVSLLLFHSRLVGLLDSADGALSWFALAFFVAFTELAWLYGFYNMGVVAFAAWYRRRYRETQSATVLADADLPSVAVLYTTCNDFVEASARSCVEIDYPDFTVYLLDDSTDPDCKANIDAFAREHGARVRVVRREDRRGFKAGNLNHALERVAHEPFFVIADADEILPREFLRALVPRMLDNDRLGFIQANHRANPSARTELARSMGLGIDIHWRWYQPLRNRYGFVMFLGHGALLRRSCWELVAGFPEIVSEDLGYALAIREHGYYGRFAEDVVCFEDFPDTVRAFRVRHVKWTRGTCEFLASRMGWLLRSRRIPWTEKIDVLFPTLNLPLSFGYFLFMIDAGLVLPWIVGEDRPMTLFAGGREWILPMRGLPEYFASIFTPGFFALTVATILAPVLCFIVELWRRPWSLFRFLTFSTALYAALSPISALSVMSYMVTGKARFLVTGDRKSSTTTTRASVVSRIEKFLAETHPDHWGVPLFEVSCGLVFVLASLSSFQVSFFGLAIGFLLLPLMHFQGWNHGPTRALIWLPFGLILAGIVLGGASLVGLQPALFGYGFHF